MDGRWFSKTVECFKTFRVIKLPTSGWWPGDLALSRIYLVFHQLLISTLCLWHCSSHITGMPVFSLEYLKKCNGSVVRLSVSQEYCKNSSSVCWFLLIPADCSRSFFKRCEERRVLFFVCMTLFMRLYSIFKRSTWTNTRSRVHLMSFTPFVYFIHTEDPLS